MAAFFYIGLANHVLTLTVIPRGLREAETWWDLVFLVSLKLRMPQNNGILESKRGVLAAGKRLIE